MAGARAGIAQDADGVQVTIAERNSDRRRMLRADYVVGCDGSRSLVRDAAGITQTLSDHDRLMVLLVFRSTGLHKLLERFPNKSFYNVLHPDLKGYWQFFGRVDLGTTWFFHAPVPLGTTKDNFDFRRYLHCGGRRGIRRRVRAHRLLGPARRDRRSIPHRAASSSPATPRTATRPMAATASTPASKTPPISAGSWPRRCRAGPERTCWIPTARNGGRCSRRPRATSSRRRSKATGNSWRKFDPATDKAAFEAEWQARSSGARSEVNSFEPNYEGSSIVAGPPGAACSAIGSHQFAARAGHHLAPRQLASGRNVFEELGEGFTLLDFGAPDAAAASIRRAAEASGVPLKLVRDDSAEAREFYEAALVLVRPDQFVAWDSDGDVTDAAGIIRRAVGGHP